MAFEQLTLRSVDVRPVVVPLRRPIVSKIGVFHALGVSNFDFVPSPAARGIGPTGQPTVAQICGPVFPVLMERHSFVRRVPAQFLLPWRQKCYCSALKAQSLKTEIGRV